MCSVPTFYTLLDINSIACPAGLTGLGADLGIKLGTFYECVID